jgi:hypothetical protein
VNEKQIEHLIDYHKNNGNIVICGNIWNFDIENCKFDNNLLRDVFGIELEDTIEEEKPFNLLEKTSVCSKVLIEIKEIVEMKTSTCTTRTMMPQFSLKYARKIKSISGGEVIAKFSDGSPAIVASESHSGRGRFVYFAGIPSRISTRPQYHTQVRNFSHILFAQLIEWAAGEKSEIYISDWSRNIPMEHVRPFDPRFMPSFEFFPLSGKKYAIGVIASYFKEPTSFEMYVKKPGTSLKSVRELISKKKIKWQQQNDVYSINVQLDFDDAMKIFLFEF